MQPAPDGGAIYAIARDVTDHRRAGAGGTRIVAADAMQADFRDLLLDAPAAIAVHAGPDHVFTFANPRYVRLAGRTAAADLVDKPLREALPELEGQGYFELADAVFASGERVTIEESPARIVRQADGTLEEGFFTVVVQPYRDAAGAVAGLLVHAVDVTAQVRARQEAEAARGWLEAVVRQLPIGVVIASAPSGRVALRNEAVARIWGQPLPVTATTGDYARCRGFHPDGRPYAPEEWPLARALRDGEVVTGEEVPCQRADGSAVTVRFGAAPVRDAAGTIVAAVCSVEDVTAQRTAEQALRDREREMALALAVAVTGTWSWDLVGGELIWSPEMYVALGFVPGSVTPTFEMWADRLHPDDRERTGAAIAAAIAGDGEFEADFRIIRPDGAVRWFIGKGHVLRDPFGRPLRMVGLGIDITARKEREERFARLQALTVALSGAAAADDVARVMLTEGLLAAGANGGVVLALSRSGGELVRLGAGGDGAGTTTDSPRFNASESSMLAEVIRGREPHFAVSWAEQAPRYPHIAGIRATGGDGAAAALPLLIHGRAIGAFGLSFATDHLFEPEERHFLGVLADVCAQALERARLFDAERGARAEAEAAVRARDEFLSVAAHELRNPVAGIKGSAQLLQRSVSRGRADPARLERITGAIVQTGDRLATLVEDLLDVSRLESGQFPLRPVPTDLATLAREAVERQRVVNGHRIVLEGAAVPCPVVADPDRLQQILANLFDNAVKYSPDGGEVHVILSREDDGVLLRVRDRGIGLPPESTEAIFRPFGRAANAATRNLPGMGLGLYIGRHIAEAHGGRLWAESRGEGYGTTMCLWLPTEAGGVKR